MSCRLRHAYNDFSTACRVMAKEQDTKFKHKPVGTVLNQWVLKLIE